MRTVHAQPMLVWVRIMVSVARSTAITPTPDIAATNSRIATALNAMPSTDSAITGKRSGKAVPRAACGSP
jgi:hypothetical protein